MAKKRKKSENSISENRKARFDFAILKSFEAGISLLGWETKSIRQNNAQLAESYVLLKGGEAWLIGCYVDPVSYTHLRAHET